MRRRKRAADWRAVVDKQAGSGLSAASFCRNHHLNLHQFYQWRRRFQDEQSKSLSAGFVQLIPCSKESPSGIRLRLGEEFSIDVERGFDPVTLRAVIEAIRGGRKGVCLP